MATALVVTFLASQTDSVFQETGGKVVIEVERAAPTGDWKSETALAGYAGTGYYTWRGPDLFGAPGRGILSYSFTVSSPGLYQLKIRNRHDDPDSTLHNDCFTRMDGGEWLKTFSSQRGEWTWGANHEDGEMKGPARYILANGPHVLQISGRSSAFSIDRIALVRDGAVLEIEPRESPTLFEAMAGPGPYESVAPLAAKLRLGKDLGGVLRALRERKEEEAHRMLESLSRFGAAQVGEAQAMKDSDPVGAVRTLEKIAQQFDGDEIGGQARREAETLRREPRVQAELKAEARWKAIEEGRARLRPHNGRRDPKADGFRRLNAAAIENLVAQCRQLLKAFPETLAAGRAEKFLKEFR